MCAKRQRLIVSATIASRETAEREDICGEINETPVEISVGND